MKKSVLLIFLVCCNIAFSQIGKVYLKNSKIKIGQENTYIYQPPKELEVSKEAKIKVIYNNNFDFTGGTSSLIKSAKGYEFTLKVPDSIRYFTAAIIDGKKVVDNNQGAGYDVFLKSSDMGKCLVDKVELRNYANRILTSKLNLKLDSKAENILAEYDKVYAKYPKMKEDASHGMYLLIKYSLYKDKTKPEMLAFVQKCEKMNSEDYLITANSLYRTLQMTDKTKQIQDQMLAKYPRGKYAGSKFFSDFAEQPNKTEASILESLNAYTTKFDYVNPALKDEICSYLLKIASENKDFAKLDEYEKLLSSKEKAAAYYNNYAWDLSGQDLVTPAKNIDFAEKISKRSLDIVLEQQKNSDSPEDLNGTYYMYADTYALILFKLNKYDEAFQLDDKLNQSNALGTEGKERYAALMEKTKGLETTKKYIEDELSKGTNSRVLLAQLETIFTKLNLPLDNFKTIKAKSIELVNAKKKAEIVQKLGSTDAINFSLKNLEGKVINLADLKGKVVVLDFWATWCGPCKASFPAMQELVSKYKDKNVEFLFVNTWERAKEDETTKKVNTFINDKKYSFNVVFDYDDAITTKYKIEGIPTKIVIDKNGNIIAFGSSEQDLTHLIDEQLSL